MKKSGHQHGGLFQARTRHQSAVQCQMVSRKNINTSKIIQNEPDEPVLFSCVCVGGCICSSNENRLRFKAELGVHRRFIGREGNVEYHNYIII